MPSLASTFININTAMGLRSPVAGNYTITLQDAILSITSTSSNWGGVIWFPPGIYQINTGWSIDATVTLSFAPGAILVPVVPPGATDWLLQLLGAVDAELDQIFCIEETRPPMLLGTIGRIAIMGGTMRRVFPEWWGAARKGRTSEPAVDTAAIQAAVLAAITDRERLSGAVQLPPVAINLRGSYQVSSNILIGGAIGPSIHSAIFEGSSTSGRLPTLRSQDRGSFHAALFVFSNVQQIRLRGVSFDALDRATHCLRIEFSLGRDQANFRVELEACSFINATDGSISIFDGTAVLPERGSIEVNVRHCRFAGIAKDFIRKEPSQQPEVLHRLGTTYVALAFHAAFAARLAVTGCIFEGFAWRAIRVIGATAEIVGCHFAIVESPELLFAMATDVELTQSSATTPNFASLASIGCVSRSPSFLRVTPGAQPSGQLKGKIFGSSPRVTLTSIVHRNRFIDLGIYRPPSVIWEDPSLLSEVQSRTPPMDGTLSLLGCDFGAAPEFENVPRVLTFPGNPPAPVFVPRVYIGSHLKTVFNVGTFREIADAGVAFLVFDVSSPTRQSVRSLSVIGSTDGPRPVSFRPLFTRPGGLDTWLLPFAWATWLWE